MVLNLEKIKELEKKYQNNEISLAALKNMIEAVTKETVSDKHSLVHQVLTAYETLRDLGVIKDVESKDKLQQLNS